jgi:hypothetical protein
MAFSRAIQRGSVDMVSVSVGLLMLAAVTAGTTAAIVYGREALIRQEHYKAAAYLLHGEMEAQQAAMQLTAAQHDLMGGVVRTASLDLPADRGGGTQLVYCTISRDIIQEHRAQEVGGQFAFYRITMRASWTERDYAENPRHSNQYREIEFTTSTIPRTKL